MRSHASILLQGVEVLLDERVADWGAAAPREGPYTVTLSTVRVQLLVQL
jgi:hypothetical protein